MVSAQPVTKLTTHLEPGMDRRLEPRRFRPWLWAGILLAAALASWAGYRLVQSAGVRSFSVDASRVTVATASRGTFYDYVPVRGTVTPLETVYLDVLEGGRVERVFVEAGSRVVEGQKLLELSNTSLQLDVISREAQVSEQLNNLRNTRLALEQNRLAIKRERVEIDYQITRLTRLAERRDRLAATGVIPQQDAEETADELAYYRRRREVAAESQAQDERMRLAQIASLEEAVDQLQRNLAIARRNLQALVVTAPMDGQLTALDAEIGASKAPGERLGRIDDVQDFKVTAQVDEFYVTRLRAGQRAVFTLSGHDYALVVDKVYPQVTGGSFQVDLVFGDDVPGNVRRGQTLQLRIALGEAQPALLLPAGGFYQDTGGNWAFVLDESGDRAVRRPIELGRRNPEHLEVLSGLAPGDRVIVSDYGSFAGMDRIELTH